MSGIGDTPKQFCNAFDWHFAALVRRERRMGRKEASNFGLAGEHARGKTFESFLHDGRERFVAHQHFAVS
ncbi:MAG: hypothetical protein AB7G24_07780 [Novosphingobium sp.]